MAAPKGADYGALILPSPKKTPAPSPRQRVAMKAPSTNLRSTALPTEPFKPAQQSARQRVVQTTKALPAQPTPHIPRLPNPTPQQTEAALQLAAKSIRGNLGPSPTPARLREFHQELHADPRNAGFVRSLDHYTAAAERQLRERENSVAGKVQAITSPLGLRAPAQAAYRAEHPPQQGISTPLGEINLSALAAAQIVPQGKGILGTLGKIVNEGIDLPAQSFLSGAITGKAVRSGIEGKPGELEALGQSVLSQIEHPVKTFKQAPLSTALLFAGGENVAGRLLGKVGRIGEDVATGSKGIIPAFTRQRPDLKLYGDVPAEAPQPAPQVRTDPNAPFRAPNPRPPAEGLRITDRKYNPDPLRKAAQIGYEKALPNLPGHLRQADPFQAEGWRLQRNMAGGLTKVGRVDRMRAAGEHTRRTFVKGTVNQVNELRPKHGADAVPLIAQGIVRTPETLAADLGKEAQKLRDAQPNLTRSQLGANKANLTRVEALLSDQHFLAHPEEAFAAAGRYRELQRPLEALLVHGGKLDPEALRSKLFPYAQAHMGAKYDGTALRDVNGRQLLNEQIKAHMQANGVKDVGFVSHKPNIAGGSSFYRSTLKQPGLEKFARTGEAFAKGIADHSYEGLTGNIANQATQAAQLEVRARELGKLALTPKEGGFESKAAAQLYADNSAHHLPGGEQIEGGLGKLEPIHLGSDPILEAGQVKPGDIQSTLKQFGLHQERSALAKQNGKWGLIPREVNKRLQAHDKALRAEDNLHRALQTYQQGFRRAKLNTSTRHVLGVAQEQAIRLSFEGAGNQARRAGKTFDKNLKHLAEVDEGNRLVDNAGPLGSEFRELEGALGTRGGQVASQRANDVVRKGSAWEGTSTAAYIARSADGAAHSTVGRAILAPWHGWQKLVEGGLSKLEQGTHHALLGKALKESGFIPSYRAALKLQDQGMQELIKGGLTPNKADAIARSVDDMMGNWSHQTPAVRKLIGNYAPFGLWWLNSMRWLYRLPVTHPIKTAILGALYNATRTERNKKGQGYGAQSPVPGFLQGDIEAKLPVVGKVNLAPSYYSPGGTLGPEATQVAAEQFLPQLSSIYSALKGQNPLTGSKLTTAEGKDLGPVADIGNVLAETTAGPVPFATQAQQLMQGGGKPYGTANWITDLLSKLGGPSQVKPGTQRPLDQQLVKMFLPLRFAFPSASSGGGGGGGSSTPTKAPSLRQQLARSRTRAHSAGPSLRQRLAAEQARR